MLNSFMVLGRIASLSDDTVELKVQDSVKDENGVYQNFEIFIQVGEGIMENMKEYCKVGDLVGVKGKIVNNNKLVGEKVTFLSAKKNNE